MKLLLAALLFFTVSGVAQNHVTDSSATFFPQWRKGDKHTYDFQLTKYKTQADSFLTGLSSTSRVAIEVIESRDSIYTLEWTFKSIEINDSVARDNKMVKRIQKLGKGMRIVYLVDKDGMFLGLQNWTEIRDHISASLEKLMTDFEYLKPEGKLITSILEAYSSKEAAEASVRKEIDLFHAPYGLSYHKTKPNVFKTELQNPFGGAPFPTTMSFDLVSVEDNNAQILITQRLDEAATFKIVKEYLQTMAAQHGSTMEDDQVPRIRIDDENLYDVELKDGWIRKAMTQRTSETANVSQVESYIIQQIR